MDITKYLDDRKRTMDASVLKFLPKGTKFTSKLREAVLYSLTTGGKRIRPILVLEACEAVSGAYKKAIPMAVAIEMIHTYTLIHDDLPAMDDDDFRRGLPTVHRKFGEDAAILAGDMLSALAFQIIAQSYGAVSSRLIEELSVSLGIGGVLGGQIADLNAEKRIIGKKELNFIMTHKTADLFVSSVRCGALIGGAGKTELARLTSFARHLGLAFQIIDDILDYDREQMNNYAALYSLKRARSAAAGELKLALKSLPAGKDHDALRKTAVFLAKRKY